MGCCWSGGGGSEHENEERIIIHNDNNHRRHVDRLHLVSEKTPLLKGQRAAEASKGQRLRPKPQEKATEGIEGKAQPAILAAKLTGAYF